MKTQTNHEIIMEIIPPARTIKVFGVMLPSGQIHECFLDQKKAGIVAYLSNGVVVELEGKMPDNVIVINR